MGKIGQRAVRLVSALPASAKAEEIVILCPFLAGLDPAVGMWLGPLAWHDCNAALLTSLSEPVPSGKTVFAAVFCADPFQPADDLLTILKAKRVTGVTNLPSVSFFDGEFGQTLTALNLGKARELAFLRRASARGFRTIGCASEPTDARAFLDAGAELIIEHAGPPLRGPVLGQAHDIKRPIREQCQKQAKALSLNDLIASI